MTFRPGGHAHPQDVQIQGLHVPEHRVQLRVAGEVLLGHHVPQVLVDWLEGWVDSMARRKREQNEFAWRSRQNVAKKQKTIFGLKAYSSQACCLHISPYKHMSQHPFLGFCCAVPVNLSPTVLPYICTIS